ncbi:MAG: hypothetical protein ACTSPZ_06125, partial [Promethearchaeota archaeon]
IKLKIVDLYFFLSNLFQLDGIINIQIILLIYYLLEKQIILFNFNQFVDWNGKKFNLCLTI